MKWDEIRGLLIYLKKNENVYFFINIELLYNIFKSKTKFILFILFFSLFKLSRFSFIILYTFFSINYKKTCFINDVQIFFSIIKLVILNFFHSLSLLYCLYIHSKFSPQTNKQTKSWTFPFSLNKNLLISFILVCLF